MVSEHSNRGAPPVSWHRFERRLSNHITAVLLILTKGRFKSPGVIYCFRSLFSSHLFWQRDVPACAFWISGNLLIIGDVKLFRDDRVIFIMAFKRRGGRRRLEKKQTKPLNVPLCAKKVCVSSGAAASVRHLFSFLDAGKLKNASTRQVRPPPHSTIRSV